MEGKEVVNHFWVLGEFEMTPCQVPPVVLPTTFGASSDELLLGPVAHLQRAGEVRCTSCP